MRGLQAGELRVIRPVRGVGRSMMCGLNFNQLTMDSVAEADKIARTTSFDEMVEQLQLDLDDPICFPADEPLNQGSSLTIGDIMKAEREMAQADEQCIYSIVGEEYCSYSWEEMMDELQDSIGENASYEGENHYRLNICWNMKENTFQVDYVPRGRECLDLTLRIHGPITMHNQAEVQRYLALGNRYNVFDAVNEGEKHIVRFKGSAFDEMIENGLPY